MQKYADIDNLSCPTIGSNKSTDTIHISHNLFRIKSCKVFHFGFSRYNRPQTR